jgi:PAS domain S-box-containing protein
MKAKISITTGLVPILLFMAFAALTITIWRAQLANQRAILSRHTQDVGIQASRRLEIFVESHLKIAEIFASRWMSHETRDFSKMRFEEFAGVLIEQVEGYHLVILMHHDGGRPWVVPHEMDIPGVLEHPRYDPVLQEATRTGETTLSAPLKTRDGALAFFAALPISRDGEPLGHILVAFLTTVLIENCFHERIRSEFDFEVTDGEDTLFVHHPDDDGAWFAVSTIRAQRQFPVRNRTWTLTVVPRMNEARTAGWGSHIFVLLLGLVLSAALALLVLMLQRRMEMYRSARDEALSEIAQREMAETALHATQSRYKSVFESTTDGIVILDRNSRIVEANAAACTMHGNGPGDLADASLRELVAPDHQYVLERFMGDLERTGIVRLDSVHVRKDGTRFDVEVRATDFKFGGEPRVLAVLTDVSARKHAEERLTLLSHKVLMAQEEERARLSRDLHDELGQLLTAQHLELDWLRGRMKPIAQDDPIGFDNALKLVEEATSELRRICKGLRPPLLDDLGIEPAITLLVDDFRARTSMAVDLNVLIPEDDEDVAAEDALCVYRVLQESLTNVSRHSRARHVSISLAMKPVELMLSVFDDGMGFEMSDEHHDRGSGITGMHERAHLVGGSIDVRSTPSGGTRVVLRIPRQEEKQ